MSGLATVARALNTSDPCLARIAAVHLKLPDLKNAFIRANLEAEDYLINMLNVETSKRNQRDDLDKASPDDPKHPGWPAGTPDGRGGKFRPKDGSLIEISQEEKIRILRIAARRALRLAARALLRLGAEAAANLIPILDIAADAAMVLDLANTIVGLRKLATDTSAAIDFSSKGPYTLSELQVSSSYEEFSSYLDFVKVELMPSMISKRFGSAGDGSQYHHIVTQGGANADNFTPQQLQNTNNVIPLPTLLHEAVNAEYLKPAPADPSVSFYQWVQKQPYDVQYQEGLEVLLRLHILK